MLHVGTRAAEKKSVGERVLAAGDRRLECALAVFRDVGADRLLVFLRRGPGRGKQQRMHLRVRFVGRQRHREVAEVAIEIDVVLVDAPAMGKAVRIDRVHEQHGDARRARRAHELVVVQEPDLHPGTAVAFDAVRGRRQHQHGVGVRRAEQRDVHRERLAFGAAKIRQHFRKQREVARAGRRDELGARLGIACGRSGGPGSSGSTRRRAFACDYFATGIAASASAAR